MGWIKVVGIGPGNLKDMTLRAREALQECDIVIGYITYIKLVKPLIEGKEILSSGMRKEILRCQDALKPALEGKKVCIISSGDAGIYGMAGLMYEVAAKDRINVDIEVIPGVSAFSSAASILGAPIMHDFAVISLSDHLTPLNLIEERIEYASKGDFVIALYNPKSKERPDNIIKAQKIMLKYKKGETPVGIVKDASREKQSAVITTLNDMLNYDIDMTTVIIIGNEKTYVEKDRMITPRGYIL
jgi:precorrin-3B C17-methyltransferase